MRKAQGPAVTTRIGGIIGKVCQLPEGKSERVAETFYCVNP
jgi:hypothetical protein